MFSDIVLLLRNYWTIDRRADARQSRLVRWISYAGLVIFGVMISLAVGFGAGELATNPAIPLQIRLGTMPGLLLTIALLGTLVTGINQAIRTLYLTNDMELLFSAPLRSEAVMSAKLLSRLPGTVLLTLLLTIPALIAFGISTDLGPAFYIAGTIALLLAPLFGLSAGALLAMFIVRLLPAKRVSEYLGAASIILGVLMAILFQLPRLLLGGNGDDVDPQTAAALSGFIEGIEGAPLPSMWAGQGLVDLAQGRIVSALGGLSFYLLMTGGFFILIMFLANGLYLNGWLRMQGSGITRRGYSERAGIFGSGSVEAGIATKDWFLRLRDARQLAGLVSGLIFASFFGFLFLRPGGDEGIMAIGNRIAGTPLASLFSPGVLFAGVVLYASWMTFNRAAMTALSIESTSFYILKAAPIDPRVIFRSKVLGLFVPYAILCMLMLIAGWFLLDYSAVWIPYAFVCLAIIGYGMLTISTTLGFRYPKLDWDDPRRMTHKNAGWFNLIYNFVYGVFSLIVAILPFVLRAFFPQAALLLVLLALLILAGMAWLVERWSMRTVTKAWPGIVAPG